MDSKITTSKIELWSDALRQHWIIWTAISTTVAILSFFSLDVKNSVPGWLFWLLVFISFSYFILSQVAINLVIDKIKGVNSLRKFQPYFNEIKNIEAMADMEGCYRVITKSPSDLNVQVNTLVSVYVKEVGEKPIGLGRVSRINSDDTIELIVTPNPRSGSSWEDRLKSEHSSNEKIIFSTLIPKELVPNIDDYIGQENNAVLRLQNPPGETPEGVQLT